MPEVTVHLGLKMPVPGVQYSIVDVDVTLAGIDPEGDVEAQITTSLETATQAFVALDKNVEVALTEILAPETGVPGYRERLGEVEGLVAKLAKGFNELVPKIRDHIQAEGHEGDATKPSTPKKRTQRTNSG